MESIRQAAVAGTFYPSDPKELREMIDGFYEEANDQPTIGKVLIAPHARLVYSGPIAASCYAPLKKRADEINNVDFDKADTSALADWQLKDVEDDSVPETPQENPVLLESEAPGDPGS